MHAAPSPSRSRRWPWLVAVAGLVVVAAVAGGLYWYLRDDSPSAVDLSATRDAISDGTATGSGGTALGSEAGGIEGVWTVDTAVGEFSVEADTTATFVGFRVQEELSSIGSTTAIGRTPEVSGMIEIAGTAVTAAEITADLTGIVSNESRRESAIQRSLDTGTNPEATFVLSAPIELGDGAATGELVQATAGGQLTINGVTNEVEFAIEAQLVEGMVLVTGSTEIVFADYGVETPTAPIVVSVEDNGIVELQLWFSS
jgi:polyisoprenoid-binding protein YceI